MNKINLTVLLIGMIVFSFAIPLVSAHGDETFLNAEHIIAEQTPCNELTDGQLANIGDYYMEQMHPGEQHEYMDEVMGGEGSESLEAMHINMALAIYCGADETEYRNTGYGMRGMMSGAYGPGMMQGYYPNSYVTGFQWIPLSIAIIIVLLVILIALQIKKQK